MKHVERIGTRGFRNKNSPGPIPDHWTLVVKEQKDGSSLSYYTCPESGQKFYTYEDLMRYVNYAKAAKLSIYSPDFRPRNQPRKPKKKVSMPDLEQIEISSDSEDSIFELPSIASLEFMEVASPAQSSKQSSSGKMKAKKTRASNEGCSSNKGKAKKQKK
ncbi:uncharacterized protein LOC111304694 [Durio zibethinus]|uniref:Uncharacterized protein LOC111304694 n=1 Tax=Durio zibethinus TaxID=66656 RepID=A0A6P5ZWT3_DURZI|nr:uncharacterized protein LOC111304694 [Durio zibethinus]XP_022757239.1 uncharacterized protein LOC111304694 [Durio zibethinus]XP_022757240.1 uncharacterized protein LOC111304694 [Durio zibethinus]XP_022757241.1 uncharacterized protein LOC111304694 [Durio zibethinus]XP_022757242.1 uncharacterized protein LOC111304694 [Durio zibethinus]XP_022757243.1 uncharacterized protein LOC111304694 [Durio zibethinus]XP_022757244.1 uncharacterized protein LOC111304694 [Durio zibethinus]XP_022757245.1 unc